MVAWLPGNSTYRFDENLPVSAQDLQNYGRPSFLSWSLGWMVAWLDGCLIGELLGWMVAWLDGGLVGWLLGWMVAWLDGRLVGWLVA